MFKQLPRYSAFVVLKVSSLTAGPVACPTFQQALKHLQRTGINSYIISFKDIATETNILIFSNDIKYVFSY